MGARYSAPVKTSPGDHPASYTMGIRSLPGVKQLRHGINQPLSPHSSAEVKERVELYTLSGPLWPVLG